MIEDAKFATDILLGFLEGTTFVNALRRNGKPCRIRLPKDANYRAALVEGHLLGESVDLSFHAEDHEPWREQVNAVVLARISHRVR